ncbi:MAG: hypothetical protein ACM3S1_14095 [Hyphomicrobiales bacterium]
MSTMTDERDEGNATPPMPLHNVEIAGLFRCARCKLSYLPNKSTSALKLTYCSFLCELGDLGFSMAGLEHMELKAKDEQPPREPEAVGAP